MTASPEIVARIAKCDRLATSSNPSEAAAAKAMAAKLRAKYQVAAEPPHHGNNFRRVDFGSGERVDPDQFADLLRRAFG